MNWAIIVSNVRISLRRLEVSCIVSIIRWLKLLLFLVNYTLICHEILFYFKY